MSSNSFISHLRNTVNEVLETTSERGDQYADTWGKDGCWHITKAVAQKCLGITLTTEQCEVLGMSVLCDQKYSRYAGGYKRDTSVDMVSYLSALTSKVESFSKE